jgi:hypothetical protein
MNDVESVAYSTIASVQKRIAEIAAVEKPIIIHVHEDLFASEGDIGTRKWAEDVMQRNISKEISISTYRSLSGWSSSPETQRDAVHVMISTDEQLKNATNVEALKNVRILPVAKDNVINLGRRTEMLGWQVTLPMIGWATVLAAVTPQQVMQDGSAADEILDFMQQVLKKPDLTREHLYTMLPLGEIQAQGIDIEKLSDEVKGALNAGLVGRIGLLIRKLLFAMPITPYDPMEALKQRLKVMWSA